MDWQEFRRQRAERGCQRLRPLVIGHRGAPLFEPENTLASFALALAQGADVLETDVRITRDGQFVLFHDGTLERMTDGQGRVAEQTLGEIKRLRTRHPNGSYTPHKVPTLIELLAYTGGDIPLLLELKDPRFAQYRHGARLTELLGYYGVLTKCAIVSFNPIRVDVVQATGTELPGGYITMWNPLPLQETELLGPLWPLLFLNPLYVAWAHWREKIVAPLDPSPEPRLRFYLAWGVDALLSDDPAKTVQALNEYGV